MWYDFCIYTGRYSTDLLATELSVSFLFAGTMLATAKSPRSYITSATLSEEQGQGPIVLDVAEQATDQLGG